MILLGGLVVCLVCVKRYWCTLTILIVHAFSCSFPVCIFSERRADSRAVGGADCRSQHLCSCFRQPAVSIRRVMVVRDSVEKDVRL
jgi:hypothetical protein